MKNFYFLLISFLSLLFLSTIATAQNWEDTCTVNISNAANSSYSLMLENAQNVKILPQSLAGTIQSQTPYMYGDSMTVTFLSDTNSKVVKKPPQVTLVFYRHDGSIGTEMGKTTIQFSANTKECTFSNSLDKQETDEVLHFSQIYTTPNNLNVVILPTSWYKEESAIYKDS